MQAIVRELKKSGKFTLPSFGTFTVRKMKAGKALAKSRVQIGATNPFYRDRLRAGVTARLCQHWAHRETSP
jgi:hypothetical protein